jgi:hypothetical protein
MENVSAGNMISRRKSLAPATAGVTVDLARRLS